MIFGTGYRRPTPPFLEPITDRIAFDDRGRLSVTADYRLDGEFGGPDDDAGRVFVQNAELHSHGVGTPDLGLGCYRNAIIIDRLAGHEIYPVDRDTIFQDFDVDQFADHASVHTDAPQSLSLTTE